MDYRFPLDGVRKHKMMTKELAKTIPELYATENVKTDDKTIVAKFFSPYSNWTWYITEFDGEDTMFGFVDGQACEWGYISLSELAGAGKPMGRHTLPLVERDLYFHPVKFSELKDELRCENKGSV